MSVSPWWGQAQERIWTSSPTWRPRSSAGPAGCPASSAPSPPRTWRSRRRSPGMDSRSRFSSLSSEEADKQVHGGCHNRFIYLSPCFLDLMCSFYLSATAIFAALSMRPMCEACVWGKCAAFSNHFVTVKIQFRTSVPSYRSRRVAVPSWKSLWCSASLPWSVPPQISSATPSHPGREKPCCYSRIKRMAHVLISVCTKKTMALHPERGIKPFFLDF